MSSTSHIALRFVQLLKAAAYVYTTASILMALRKFMRLRHTRARLTGPATTDPCQHSLFCNHYVMSKKGLWLFTRSWVPTSGPIRGVIFIIHGMNEHILRYEAVAEMLKANGFAVFGMDNQGMGRSEGDRLHVEHFLDYVEDYLDFMRGVLDEKTIKSPGKPFIKLPRFILAHSMGTVIGIRLREACEAANIPLDGIILSGAALMVDPGLDNPVMRIVSRVLSSLFPKMPAPKIDARLISEDDTVVEHYLRDPLVTVERPTMKFGKEAVDSIRYCQSYCKQLTEPLLIVHGADDKLCFPQSSNLIYDQAASKDKTLKIYDGISHELFNSLKRDKVLSDILQWLNVHLPPSSPSKKSK